MSVISQHIAPAASTVERITDMKKRVVEINLSVSWMDFANRYFHKSSAWFYNKLNGRDGNGAWVDLRPMKPSSSVTHSSPFLNAFAERPKVYNLGREGTSTSLIEHKPSVA